MSTFKKFIAIGTVSAVSLLGAGVAGAASTHGPQSPNHTLSALAAKTKKVAFKETFTGTLKLTFGATTATASILTSKGTGALAGAKVTGSGSGADTAQSGPFTGTGAITLGTTKLVLSVIKTASSVSTDATASGPQDPPANVTVMGSAKVTSGTGKYKGATGTLKFQGSFTVTNATTGTSETDSFTVTLTGTLTVKR